MIDDSDYYKTIRLDDLKALFEIEDLDKRETKFIDLSEFTQIGHSDDINYILVIDGHNNEESWEELKEALNEM